MPRPAGQPEAAPASSSAHSMASSASRPVASAQPPVPPPMEPSVQPSVQSCSEPFLAPTAAPPAVVAEAGGAEAAFQARRGASMGIGESDDEVRPHRVPSCVAAHAPSGQGARAAARSTAPKPLRAVSGVDPLARVDAHDAASIASLITAANVHSASPAAPAVPAAPRGLAASRALASATAGGHKPHGAPQDRNAVSHVWERAQPSPCPGSCAQACTSA